MGTKIEIRECHNWRKTMEIFKTNWNRALLLLFFLTLAAFHARGDDTYNFYFKKDPAKKVETQDGQKVIVVPDDSQKKYYIKRKKQAPVAPVGSTVHEEKPKKENKDQKKWMMSLGVGSILGRDSLFGKYKQATYAVGGRYLINRYFDINGELQLPNGDPEGGYYTPTYSSVDMETGLSSYGGGYQTMDRRKAEGSIGIGVTPIHLALFGSELIEIGVDGGVMFGQRPETATGVLSSTSSVYFGPRVGVNFNDKFSLNYSYKRDTTHDDFSHSSLTLGYRW